MAWLYIKNTEAVAKKFKSDLSKILWITDIVIQVAFILYYVYLTITNIDKSIFHEVYASFFIAGIAMLIFGLISKKQKVDKHKRRFIKDIVRWVKYPIRIFLIALTIFEIINYNGTPVAIILVSISIILLAIQIIFHLILRIINKYIDYFSESLKMDYEQSDLIRAAVNSRKVPSEKKAKGLEKLAKNIVTDKVNDFVNEHKDSVALKEPTKYEAKIREDIAKIKK